MIEEDEFNELIKTQRNLKESIKNSKANLLKSLYSGNQSDYDYYFSKINMLSHMKRINEIYIAQRV